MSSSWPYVIGAIVVGLVLGIKRYGGWNRWAGDIRKGLRQQKKAGFLIMASGYAGWCATAAALAMAIWWLYARQVLLGANPDIGASESSMGRVLYAAAAVLFALAALGMACLLRLLQRAEPPAEYVKGLSRSAGSIVLFGIVTIVAMLWRPREAQLPLSIWWYLLPVAVATLAAVWPMLALWVITKRGRGEHVPEGDEERPPRTG